MKITLRPKHEQLIAEAIQSGAYRNADQVIGRALEALRSDDEWLRERKGEIDLKIDRALAQFERGEFYTAEECKTNMSKRKAAWLAAHKR